MSTAAGSVNAATVAAAAKQEFTLSTFLFTHQDLYNLLSNLEADISAKKQAAYDKMARGLPAALPTTGLLLPGHLDPPLRIKYKDHGIFAIITEEGTEYDIEFELHSTHKIKISKEGWAKPIVVDNDVIYIVDAKGGHRSRSRSRSRRYSRKNKRKNRNKSRCQKHS